MRKKLIICLSLCLLLTGCGNNVPELSNGDDAIIEFGNGDMISANEVWDEVKTSYGLQTIINKMNLMIFEKEFKDEKDDVDEYVTSVEASLKANYLDKDGNLDEQGLNDALVASGFSGIEQYLEVQKLGYYEDLATTEYAEAQVTDKEIEKYYKDEVEGDIHAVHILVKPKSDSTDDLNAAKEEAEKIIADIKKDVKSGTEVLAAFEKYMDKEEVTYEDLGYFNKGKMEEAFEEAAYKLKTNAYSKTPVKTSYGYHVILKIDQKEKESLEDMEDEIRETLAQEAIEEDLTMTAKAIIELRDKHEVKFHDEELEQAYNKYMNYLLNQ